jgi:UDP-4-amino-4,6-dideoxy-N-acetyl-beta-L-altrosamine N-acetyltransferase
MEPVEPCTIRSLAHQDLPMLLSWRNHPTVRRSMFTQHEINAEEHRQWFDDVSAVATRKLLIVEDQTGPIGFVQFSNASPSGVADWGFYADPNKNKGVGRKLGETALNFAFGPLNLHKVCGQAILTNQASVNFHKRLGFLQEGILRDQKFIAGVYHPLVCFGMLNHEWHANKSLQKEESA